VFSELREEDDKAERKALARIGRYEKESRYLVKRSEESGALEEVFDRATLMTMYRLMNAGFLSYLNGIVAAGKEARVYWGITPEGKDVAVKIFLTLTSEFKRRLQYIEGDPRFKRIRGNTIGLIELWARKEFKNLQRAQRAGIRVPSPLVVKRNVLIMEFIGSDGKPYPVLAERAFGSDYRKVVTLAKRLYRQAGLVHADLSEYNIFKGKTELVLFDFASAVDISHPQAQDFLIRDLNNVNRFFIKQKVSVEGVDRLFKRITGNEIQADSKSPF